MLIITVLAGNSSYLANFAKFRRGAYTQLFSFLASDSVETPITISSDQDFRAEMLLEYYRGRVPGAEALQYLESEAPAALASRWYLRQTQDPYEEPLVDLERGVHRYELVRTYPFTALSGATYFAYRRTD